VSRLVVKVGGAVAAESASRILGLAEEGHQICVVHGAGPQITEEMLRRGIPVEFVAGRRRTSLAALEVVRESMEAVNAELCAALGDLAVPIIGLTGMALVVFLLLTSLPSVIVGIGLLRHSPWARIAGIVLSIVSLIMIPFGTMVGVYGLWVLFSKDTERLFMAPAPLA